MTIELSHEITELSDSGTKSRAQNLSALLSFEDPLKCWAVYKELTSTYFYYLFLPTLPRQNGKFWTEAYTFGEMGLIVPFHPSTLGTN